ncbi:hypothetical protein DDZ16_05450 [Marinilabilia rubra]|uniref:Uncharacterized protein n=1 Tax=Marinilabilia rubra TaxID=2162893 RepID=A0A2U2BBD3_9BACT|nr:hypothetical protein DDZ16_05450 [Marinilabilia rubra]
MSGKQIRRDPGTELLRIRYDGEGSILKSGECSENVINGALILMIALSWRDFELLVLSLLKFRGRKKGAFDVLNQSPRQR